MEKVADWFTPTRRKRLYRALVPVFAILTAHGLVTADDAVNVIAAAGYLLGAGAMTLADKNVNVD